MSLLCPTWCTGLEFFVCTPTGVLAINLVFGRIFRPLTADWVIDIAGSDFPIFADFRRGDCF